MKSQESLWHSYMRSRDNVCEIQERAQWIADSLWARERVGAWTRGRASKCVESTCERRSWKRSHFATEFIGAARTENRSSAPPRWISFPRHYVAIGIRGGTFVLAQHLPPRDARTMPRYLEIQEALAPPSRPSLYILE